MDKEPTGNIFGSGQTSAYEDAMKAALQEDTQPAVPSEPAAPPPPDPHGPPPNSPPSFSMSPPPFAENNRKRLIIVAVLVLGIIALIFLLIRFLRGAGTQPEAKPVDQKITLNYWGLWEDESSIRLAIDEYQKQNPTIVVNYSKQDPKQYRERLQSAIDRGEGPDIFRFHNSWVPMLKNHLAPLPKDIMSDTDFEKTFYPVAAADLKSGQNYYGIPLMIDGLLLLYNEDILKGANVDPPVTWVDVQNAVAKITVKENDRIVTSAIALGTAENVEHFSDILGLMMLQNGTILQKSLFSCVDTTSTSCAVEALTFYRKFGEPPNNTWDDTLDNSIAAFAGGKVAMILAPSWQIFTIKQINPDLKFKVTAPPQLPCDRDPCPSVNWASYWVEGVSPKSKNATESWKLLQYLSQADTMEKMYTEQAKQRQLFGEPYSRTDLGNKLADNPYIAPLIKIAPSLKSYYLASRTNDGDTGLDSSLIKYLKDAVNATIQNTSPESALKTADNGFNQVYQRFGITPAQ